MHNLTKEQIWIAANWWADKFSNPTFDNGANDSLNSMAQLLASRLVQPIDREKVVAVFVRELTAYQGLGRFPSLSVDYDPTLQLLHIMNKAQVPRGNAPWKTRMFFHEDGAVSARAGYGAPEVAVINIWGEEPQ